MFEGVVALDDVVAYIHDKQMCNGETLQYMYKLHPIVRSIYIHVYQCIPYFIQGFTINITHTRNILI